MPTRTLLSPLSFYFVQLTILDSGGVTSIVAGPKTRASVVHDRTTDIRHCDEELLSLNLLFVRE